MLAYLGLDEVGYFFTQRGQGPSCSEVLAVNGCADQIVLGVQVHEVPGDMVEAAIMALKGPRDGANVCVDGRDFVAHVWVFSVLVRVFRLIPGHLGIFTNAVEFPVSQPRHHNDPCCRNQLDDDALGHRFTTFTVDSARQGTCS